MDAIDSLCSMKAVRSVRWWGAEVRFERKTIAEVESKRRCFGFNNEGEAGRNLEIVNVQEVTRCRCGSTFNASISNDGSPNPVALLPRYNYKAGSQSHASARFMLLRDRKTLEASLSKAGCYFQLHLFEQILERMLVVTSTGILTGFRIGNRRDASINFAE